MSTDTRTQAYIFPDPIIQRDTQRNQMICPHCGNKARIRVSRRLSRLYSDGVVECQDLLACGWRGRYGLEIICTITPSASPASELNLPLSPHTLLDPSRALPAKPRTTPRPPVETHKFQGGRTA